MKQQDLDKFQEQLRSTKKIITTLKQAKWAASFKKNPKIWRFISHMYEQNGDLNLRANDASIPIMMGSMFVGMLAGGIVGGILTGGLGAIPGTFLGGFAIVLITGSFFENFGPTLEEVKSEKMEHYHTVMMQQQNDPQPNPSV